MLPRAEEAYPERALPIPGALRFEDREDTRRFIRWLLACLLALPVLIGASNAVVDPTDQFPWQFIEHATSEPPARDKFQLFKRRDWDLLITGDSRVTKYDPRIVRKRGGPSSAGFNSATYSTRLIDQVAWALYALDHPGPDGKPPQLVLTLPHYAVSQLEPSPRLLEVPELRATLERHGSASGWVREGRPEATPRKRWPTDLRNALWGRDTTRLTQLRLSAALESALGQPVSVEEYRTAPGGVGPYAADGVQLDRPYQVDAISDPRSYRRNLHRAQLEDESPVRGSAIGRPVMIEPAKVMLLHLMRSANAKGIRPVIVLLPLNHEYRQGNARPARRRYARQLSVELERLQRMTDFEVVDLYERRYTDVLGNHRAWLDGWHPTSATARRIMLDVAARSRVLQATDPPPAPRPPLAEQGS